MTATHPPDSQLRGFVALLPAAARPYALLARFDRPIGWWLLYWPCAWGLALGGGAVSHWPLFLWMLLGAIVMRGAGCVYNDIVDRDLDAKVARTASRPVASGAVSMVSALLWTLFLSLVGLLVLLQLPGPAQIVALASLILVAAYPFMKRITWWPQAWLGLVFTWGALVGWVALRSDHLDAMLALYGGAFFWCMGYDTIYACQDREDDALVGIKSSALRLGNNVQAGVIGFYCIALTLWGLAFWLLRADWLALLALLPAGLHLMWQGVTLRPDSADNALARFRSNRVAGALVAAACFVVGNA